MTDEVVASRERPTVRAVVTIALSWIAYSGVIFLLSAIWGVLGLLWLNGVLAFFWLAGRSFDKVLQAEEA